LPDNAHIESFLSDLRDTHLSGVGVKETSYYPYLSNLLNFTGKALKPKVRCIIHPRSIGAGLPDGAMITADQKSKADDPLAEGMVPSRGVLEIKAPDEDVQTVVSSEQVAKYLRKYGLVVVANLRQWVIVARVQGQPTQLEAFTIAPSEKAFWKAVENPRKLTEAVWEYAIGGYQVLKKWLSYRERQVLGRDITKDEAREFTHIVRRIAALLRLEPELDKSYSAVKANCHPWSAASSGTKEDV
jgi:hypothetical protein